MTFSMEALGDTSTDSPHSLFLHSAFRRALAREFRLQALNLRLNVQGETVSIPAYRKGAGQWQQLIIGAGFDKTGEFSLPPSLGYVQCMQQLVSALQQDRQYITQLKIRSKHPLPGFTDYSDKVELSIQPDKPLNEWLQELSASTRRNIRLPFKRGLRYETGHGRLHLDRFYRLYRQHMHTLGSLAHSYRFFSELQEKCRDQISLCIGYFGEKPVIASFDLLSGQELYGAWLGMDAAYKKHNVLLGLIWFLTEYCQQHKLRYNLGRSSVNSSAYQFKKRLATHEQHIYYYDLNLRTGQSAILPGTLKKPLYRAASAVIRHSPPLLMQSLSRHLIHRFY